MLFNSWIFIIFAVVVYSCYYRVRLRSQNVLLLIASYIFYGAWDWRFLGLIIASTVVDYLIGLRIHAAQKKSARRRLLLLSCVFNLGVLGFFKYFNFFVDSANSILEALHLSAFTSHLNVILPIGISFYTFQTMSYVIDIYREKLEPTRDVLNYALFVAFFPQLVAGPIERATHLLPQIEKKRMVSRDQLICGAWLILWGFFKKMVVADNLGLLVDKLLLGDVNFAGGTAWLMVYAFAFQIYCDFSGYSDIARGLAKLMGIEIMRNFELPYLAVSPSEFWRRWHISLSTWLRDYLYISLGGNRGGKARTYFNLLATMLLGGLWHGAAWNFVIWGAFHGALLIVYRFFEPSSRPDKKNIVMHGIKMIWFFHLTCIGWAIFRARDIEQLTSLLLRMAQPFSIDYQGIEILVVLLLLVIPLWIVELWTGHQDDPRGSVGWNSGLGALAVGSCIVMLLIFSPAQTASFIYFQF